MVFQRGARRARNPAKIHAQIRVNTPQSLDSRSDLPDLSAAVTNQRQRPIVVCVDQSWLATAAAMSSR